MIAPSNDYGYSTQSLVYQQQNQAPPHSTQVVTNAERGNALSNVAPGAMDRQQKLYRMDAMAQQQQQQHQQQQQVSGGQPQHPGQAQPPSQLHGMNGDHASQQQHSIAPYLAQLQQHPPPGSYMMQHGIPQQHMPQHQGQQLTQHLAPQHQAPHQATSQEYENEPLMLPVHNGNQAYYNQQMPPPHVLQLSTDYANAVGTPQPQPPQQQQQPSGSAKRAGSKRSREELNLKEKKRMFKLNDRINQLKAMLIDAGVNCKKNKQSILDNTVHYINMLRSNELINKQKVERAEQMADNYRAQLQQNSNGGSAADNVFRRYFERSSTPKLLVNMQMECICCNSAFTKATGYTEEDLRQKGNLMKNCLCQDAEAFSRLLQSVMSTKQTKSAILDCQTISATQTMRVVVSLHEDEAGTAEGLEINLYVPHDDENIGKSNLKSEPLPQGGAVPPHNHVQNLEQSDAVNALNDMSASKDDGSIVESARARF